LFLRLRLSVPSLQGTYFVPLSKLEAIMFELDDPVIEEIIFAMENQDSEATVNIETGEVTMHSGLLDDYSESDADLDSDSAADLEDTDPESQVPVPEWTSADGFRLMESFASGVGDPVARTELMGGLSRGRGVFRAFKNTLEQYPEIERRWFEYKHAAMGRRVAEWYDALREASGLARLGPEPEDDTDLILGDFNLRKAGRSAWVECGSLFKGGLDEILEHLPRALAEYEYSRIEKELAEGGSDGLALYLAEAPAGALAGVAAVRRITVSGSSFGKLVYLYVDVAHRKLGLARRLAEKAREDFAAEGIARFVIDLPFAPEGFGRSLAAYGYEAFGTRCLATGN
jgi:GNAT superfamily N-acetyltransferase